MTVEEGDVEEKKKRTVLVGIRLDKIGRELLNWALVKVAEPGDRVIALHARRDTDLPDSNVNPSLDSYLEVYKGLCNVKKLDLTGQISRGNSVRKILVREAKVCGAMAIVVGVSRKNTLGTWVYVAKYCAKRLPPSTTVLAIHNGKIVFQRGFTKQLSGINGDPKPSLEHSQLPEIENHTTSTQVVQIQRPEVDVKKHSQLPEIENHTTSTQVKMKYNSFSLENVKKQDRVSSRSISCGGNAIRHSISLDLMKEIPESRPGWPLLRSAVSVTPNRKELEGRKMSVVQWVMSLPNRTPLPTLETQTGFVLDKTEIQFKSESIDCRSKSTKNCLEAWGELPKELELLVKTKSSNCRWFSHQELKNATSDFSSENLIGKGGCSRVYKGFLSDGKPVAVKVLKVSKQSWEDFILEVDIISVLKHKNITPLIGVGIDNNDLILVYDFLSKGSLEENLHVKEEKSALSWEVRFKMAIGIAEAISYLHNECSRPVIHRDIKSSNVLLTDDLEPQLSDFGLAVWAPTSSSHTQSDVVGTFGYLAPEYFMYGKVSDKIDVYSFGVVLLELLSGRRPISTETPKGQESLVMWAKPILESGDIHGILDPDLTGNFDEVQMRRMVLAVTLCLTRAARLRPQMKQILNLLQGEKDVEKWVNSDTNDAEEDNQDVDEAYPESSVESHLGVALLDVEDESTSFSSIEQSNHHTLEDYLKGRWSRSSSFD